MVREEKIDSLYRDKVVLSQLVRGSRVLLGCARRRRLDHRRRCLKRDDHLEARPHTEGALDAHRAAEHLSEAFDDEQPQTESATGQGRSGVTFEDVRQRFRCDAFAGIEP